MGTVLVVSIPCRIASDLTGGDLGGQGVEKVAGEVCPCHRANSGFSLLNMDGDKSKRADKNDRRGAGLAPFGIVYVLLLAAGVAGALVVYFLLVSLVPGAGSSRLEAMKTALLVVAGSGAGAGLYVQYRKQHTDETRSVLDHANSRRDQDKLFTERYTQAVTQLESDKAAVRLGGVYALARIADDSERDRPTCLEVLCAYLRMPYDPQATAADLAERQVRVTAQTVVADRLSNTRPGFWADADVDLRGAWLINVSFNNARVRSGAFTNAVFDGYTNFVGTAFSGNAMFGYATFTGPVWFQRATFGMDVRFEHAEITQEADFREATVGRDARFNGARFGGTVTFAGTVFSGQTWFAEATFAVEPDFTGATFHPDHRPVWPDGFPEPSDLGTWSTET